MVWQTMISNGADVNKLDEFQGNVLSKYLLKNQHPDPEVIRLLAREHFDFTRLKRPEFDRVRSVAMPETREQETRVKLTICACLATKVPSLWLFEIGKYATYSP